MRARESERRSGELRGVVQKHSGEQAERRWRSKARVRRAHALRPTGARLKTTLPLVGWAGFAQLGCYRGGPGKWATRWLRR